MKGGNMDKKFEAMSESINRWWRLLMFTIQTGNLKEARFFRSEWIRAEDRRLDYCQGV
jgi:hypothetical protein